MIMQHDERENNPDLIQELKKSRLRLKYNWENLFKKYENIKESGIEIQLDTFEVFAPEGMDRRTVTKEVEKHEFLGSQFGTSALAAPCNDVESLEGCHPKVIAKCRKMDKEFSKIHQVLAVVPHRQKLWKKPVRPKKIIIRKTIREDIIAVDKKSLGFRPIVAIDDGMTDGPVPQHIQSALQSEPKRQIVCPPSSQIPFPAVALKNGLEDGPISSTMCIAESKRRSLPVSLMGLGCSGVKSPSFNFKSAVHPMLTNGLSDGPIETNLMTDELCYQPEEMPDDTKEDGPIVEFPSSQSIIVNDGLCDGPLELSQSSQSFDDNEGLDVATISSQEDTYHDVVSGRHSSHPSIMFKNGLEDGPVSINQSLDQFSVNDEPYSRDSSSEPNVAKDDSVLIPAVRRTETTEEYCQNLTLNTNVQSFFTQNSSQNSSPMPRGSNFSIAVPSPDDSTCSPSRFVVAAEKIESTHFTMPTPHVEQSKKSIKRSSTESGVDMIGAKKPKRDILDANTGQPGEENDGLAQDISILEYSTEINNFWMELLFDDISREINKSSCKPRHFLGIKMTELLGDQTLITNWVNYSKNGIEEITDGQDYVAREERRLYCSARRRNSFMVRGYSAL